MYLTPECTALSPTATIGLKKKGLNALLLCNACVENNERDNFIRCRTLSNAKEMIENLDVGGKLKNKKMRFTNLIKQKNGKSTMTTYEKVEQTYAAGVTARMQGKAEHKVEYRINHNISQSLRTQGIPEDTTKTKGENLVPTNDEVTEILGQIGVTQKVLKL